MGHNGVGEQGVRDQKIRWDYKARLSVYPTNVNFACARIVWRRTYKELGPIFLT